MKFSAVSLEQTTQAAFDKVRAKPFTKIHGRPERKDRDTLEDEACEAAGEFDLPFQWAKDDQGTNYGAVAEVIGAARYEKLTGIATYVKEPVPPAYDESITTDTDRSTAERRIARLSVRQQGHAPRHTPRYPQGHHGQPP